MKRNLIAPVLFITLLGASFIHGQGPSAKDAADVLALAQELKARQAQITDNQAKIDAKLAELEEAVRIAGIFASRAGGGHTPPKPPK